MNDQRLGMLFRAARIKLCWRQLDVAQRAGVSRALVSLVERGHFSTLSIEAIRRIGSVLDIRVDLLGRWRGGEGDKLINRRHSALHDAVATMFLSMPGWVIFPEISFAFYGERGVVDIIAWHGSSRSYIVIELKTELVDVQELLGSLDRKQRLMVPIARERGMPPPATVSRWVILVDSRTNRRHLSQHAAMLRAALPADGRNMRRWLRDPQGAISALSFMPDVSPGSTGTTIRPVKRVRAARAADRARLSTHDRDPRDDQYRQVLTDSGPNLGLALRRLTRGSNWQDWTRWRGRPGRTGRSLAGAARRSPFDRALRDGLAGAARRPMRDRALRDGLAATREAAGG